MRTKKLVLGGAVMVLLLALAFTAGVGVGRSRRPAASDPLLAAQKAPAVEFWGIRSRALPTLGLKADSLKEHVVKDLYRRWPELSSRAFIVDVADKTGKPTTSFRIVLKGFESREDALSVSSDLGMWAVDGYMPFDQSRPERMN